jgi:hypothetical protein
MTSPNIPAKSVNAWIYLDEDEPNGTGYSSLNSCYQSLVNNQVYISTDMLFICFFAVVPDGKGYFTIDIGNKNVVHPDGSSTEQYLRNTIRDARAQNSGIRILATLNYNTNTLSQIFSADQKQWPVQAAKFASNVKNYLQSMQMNGFDIDWEGDFAFAITPLQFSILFQAIRSAFNSSAGTYLYLTMCPAETGNLDVATVNKCFDLVTLQLYSGFTNPSDFTAIGINPLLLAYGAKFESNYQNANQAYNGAKAGFNFNGKQYVYNNITQWRLNSGNYIFEQGQQILLYQLAYDQAGTIFNDGAIVARCGNPALASLIIRSGDVVDAVQATNNGVINGNPGPLALLQHGGNGGSYNIIDLNAGDFITEISGYTGTWFGWNVVAQFSIKTSDGILYGPFGSLNNVTNQKAFTYTAQNGQRIVALNGSTIQVPTMQGNTTLVIAELSVSYAQLPVAELSTMNKK